MKKNVYVVGPSLEYASWLLSINFTLVKHIDEASLILFTGGEDVNPKIYDESIGRHTYVNFYRDEKEELIYHTARAKEIPMLGICRGGQFLTVMNGGKMIQDVTNHGGMHDCELFDRTQFRVTSTHHQMMWPYNLPQDQYKMLGWVPKPLSKHYLNGKNVDIDLPEDFVEPEIIVYPKTKCLSIQSHPEYLDQEDKNLSIIQTIFMDFYEGKFN